jgi:hypothetical protein
MSFSASAIHFSEQLVWAALPLTKMEADRKTAPCGGRRTSSLISKENNELWAGNECPAVKSAALLDLLVDLVPLEQLPFELHDMLLEQLFFDVPAH